MIFESLWPLLFIGAVPVIIILYLLKPKGKDFEISSTLLWQKILVNEQSHTFLEKFIHNLLMYLQIAILLLLMVSLMSPLISQKSLRAGRKIILLDTSGSMQMENGGASTRFDEAISQITRYIRSAEDQVLSLVTCDAMGANILAIDSTDKELLIRTLENLTPNDCASNLTGAQSILSQLALNGEQESASLIVCTDAGGAAEYDLLQGFSNKELWVVGKPVNNVSNNYLVFTEKEDGLYDIMASVTNYANCPVSLEISLRDEDGSVLSVKQLSLAEKQESSCLFSDVSWTGETCSSVLSSFAFADKKPDSLPQDNTSYAVKHTISNPEALLIGEGNTYLEKAYQAITGSVIAKTTEDHELQPQKLRIYDAGYAPADYAKTVLAFGCTDGSVETVEHIVLDVDRCDLTAGLENFQLGVNKAFVFDPPAWAASFLSDNGKCVGYYGEHDGKREVILGFDIRESDFALRPEFPIFLSNAMTYLTNSSWLATNIYYAGERLAIQPWADQSILENYDAQAKKSGLYRIESGDYHEYYTVRFPSAESDGSLLAQSVKETGAETYLRVKKTLRRLFLILALLLLAAEWILYVRQLRYKGLFYKLVRGVVVLLLLLALFDVKLPLHSNRTTTIFVVDLSNSNSGNRKALSDYLENTIRKMPARNQYGIVAFGKNTLVEQFLTPQPYFSELMSLPEKTATNFEEAISRALSMIPADHNGRLVILTDGKQTKGDIQNLSYVISGSGTELLSILYETQQTKDAYISGVDMPSYLHPDDVYTLSVKVESNYDTDATLSLYYASSLSNAYDVHLNTGENLFVFQQKVSDTALENLKLVLDADQDTCPENNAFNAYAVIEANPKILVISGTNSATNAFLPLLHSISADYNIVAAQNAPRDINSMLAFKSIILVDTYLPDLPDGFVKNIETYVKDYGCGLICCGGENSFALGGYRNTPLETVLPVNMSLKTQNETPSMAMVMIIDRSGSMSSTIDANGMTTNLDIAIRAASVALDSLSDEDYVGVLTFDDTFHWQAKLGLAKERTEIKKAIQSIPAGGGTTIKPSLAEACKELKKLDVSIKHVILLTDGMGETTDFHDVIQDYQNAGITLSTVAVGDGSDTGLLEQLANSCAGRYYYTDISTNIPRIFAQEVFLGADSYLQDGDIPLDVYRGHELTKNLFPEGWPNIKGYIASTAKSASHKIIQSADKENPILTVWQYGLGHTVAWNCDVSGKWSAAYAGETDYAQLWRRLIDYSTGNTSLGEDSVNVVTANDTSVITYEAKNSTENTKLYATVIQPDGETAEIALTPTAPGTYETKLDTDTTGLYHFTIRREDDGEITNHATTASIVQFSDEYKFDIKTDAYVSFIEKYGKAISPQDNIWKKVNQTKQEKRPLTNLLLALGILAFLADVALRRFQYVPNVPRLIQNRRHKEQTAAADALTKAPGSAQTAGTDTAAAAQTSTDTAQTAGPESAAAGQTTEQAQQQTSKKAKPKKEKKKQESDQTLDTSLLLRKKDDRNL